MINALERDGFAIVPAVMEQPLVLQLVRDIERRWPDMSIAGVRALAGQVPSVQRLSQSRVVRNLVEPVLGARARLVRSVLFTKSGQTNWHVGWHQDLAIAVQAKADVGGFVSWSVKEGVPHVQSPVVILEQMLTVRLHLDAADESNGALWMCPGSHRLGRLPANEAAERAGLLGKRSCSVQAGDALLFRPLTLHASFKATSDRPRRVIHLEFAGVSLPEPLAWAEPAA